MFFFPLPVEERRVKAAAVKPDRFGPWAGRIIGSDIKMVIVEPILSSHLISSHRSANGSDGIEGSAFQPLTPDPQDLLRRRIGVDLLGFRMRLEISDGPGDPLFKGNGATEIRDKAFDFRVIEHRGMCLIAQQAGADPAEADAPQAGAGRGSARLRV